MDVCAAKDASVDDQLVSVVVIGKGTRLMDPVQRKGSVAVQVWRHNRGAEVVTPAVVTSSSLWKLWLILL